MKKAKNNKELQYMCVVSQKLYIYQQEQLDAINYYRHNHPQRIKWEPVPVPRIFLLNRYPTDSAPQKGITLYTSPIGPYTLTYCLFLDEASQIWLFKDDKPLVNISDWVKEENR